MRRTILRHRAVLHIPQQAWDGERLVDLDLTGEKEELLAELTAAGVESLFQTEAVGYYKGRRYPESLLTIYGEAETTAAASIFSAWNKRHRETLRQEAFAYELDGELFVYQY